MYKPSYYNTSKYINVNPITNPLIKKPKICKKKSSQDINLCFIVNEYINELYSLYDTTNDYIIVEKNYIKKLNKNKKFISENNKLYIKAKKYLNLIKEFEEKNNFLQFGISASPFRSKNSKRRNINTTKNLIETTKFYRNAIKNENKKWEKKIDSTQYDLERNQKEFKRSKKKIYKQQKSYNNFKKSYIKKIFNPMKKNLKFIRNIEQRKIAKEYIEYNIKFLETLNKISKNDIIEITNENYRIDIQYKQIEDEIKRSEQYISDLIIYKTNVLNEIKFLYSSDNRELLINKILNYKLKIPQKISIEKINLENIQKELKNQLEQIQFEKQENTKFRRFGEELSFKHIWLDPTFKNKKLTKKSRN